ncbi:MAG: hypothetical protein AB1656_25050 [Candidatus Omnitrophota bacterium]
MGEIPPEPFSGKAFNYRTEDSGCVIYSYGWNMKDDGGVPANSGEDETNAGDIVWTLPR